MRELGSWWFGKVMILFGVFVDAMIFVALVQYKDVFAQAEHLWMLWTALGTSVAIGIGAIICGVLNARVSRSERRCAHRSLAGRLRTAIRA